MRAHSTHSTLADSYDARTDTYKVFGNNSLVGVIKDALPPGGSVLDVGCASGGLLAELADVAGRRVGIEISASAAENARANADEVLVGDIADPELRTGEQFDVVVLADVIEHTVDPQATLTHALGFCKPGGRVVVSVPNVAHWVTRRQLARGRWDYVESGVLDRSHLRFFTRRTIVAELEQAGVTVERVAGVVPRLRNHVPLLGRLPKRVAARVERGWQRLGARRTELMAYQLLIVGRVAAR